MSPILGIWASQISGHLYTPVGSYDALATVTVGTAVSSVTFAGIPTGYRHLQIRAISQAGDTAKIQFNNDTGSNYTNHNLYGNGSSAAADQGGGTNPKTSAVFCYNASSGSSFAASITDILDYANTSKNKTFKSLWGWDTNGTGYVGMYGGSWMNTSAIASMTIISPSGNFAVGSQFALYGVK